MNNLTHARFTAETPDGYQVIDVTTGEPFHFGENQILSYALAREVRAPLNHDQYVIVAVTEDEVQRDLEGGLAVEHVPGFVTFAGAHEAKVDIGPDTRLITAHVDPQDGPDEVTLSPALARQVITTAGLSFLPGARAQHRWPLLDAQEQIEAAMLQVRHDETLYQSLKDLHQLIIAINCSGGAYLVLDYNGANAMDFA
jgi:hypothetical protein